MSDSYKANEMIFLSKGQDRSVAGHRTGQECHRTQGQDRSVTGHGAGQEGHGAQGQDRGVTGHGTGVSIRHGTGVSWDIFVKTPILVLWGQCCLSVWDLWLSGPAGSRVPLEAN